MKQPTYRDVEYPLIAIDFYDHSSPHGWVDIGDEGYKTPLLCHVLGWLVAETEDLFSVSCCVVENNDCHTPFRVLKSTVIRTKRIKIL